MLQLYKGGHLIEGINVPSTVQTDGYRQGEQFPEPGSWTENLVYRWRLPRSFCTSAHFTLYILSLKNDARRLVLTTNPELCVTKWIFDLVGRLAVQLQSPIAASFCFLPWNQKLYYTTKISGIPLPICPRKECDLSREQARTNLTTVTK